jgi:hypothetical protein
MHKTGSSAKSLAIGPVWSTLYLASSFSWVAWMQKIPGGLLIEPSGFFWRNLSGGTDAEMGS